MPIYEYSCRKCGQTIEVIQKMSDPELKKHAGCGGALTKEISRAGFQFKGTGWYITDYARKSQAPEQPADAGKQSGDAAPAAAEKEAAKAPDSKPAAGARPEAKPASSAESKPAKPSGAKTK